MTDQAHPASRLDRDAYFRRIDFAGPTEPTAAVLAALHQAHVGAIPFENLDILRGKPVRLDLGSLQGKLVAAGRGGYCFEQNLLFAAVLRDLGFTVTPLAARVRFGATRVNPRTHMLLLVDAGGDRWLADVGFGADGLLRPVPLDGGRPAEQGPWTYRVRPETDGRHVLQILRRDGTWFDLYVFTLEPQHPVDFEVANHYTSTHPDSRFTVTLTAQRTTPTARYALRGEELLIDRGGKQETRTVADPDELLDVLAELFRLRFPAGMRFVRDDRG